MLAAQCDFWQYADMTTQKQRDRWAKQVRTKREAVDNLTQERLAGMSRYSLSYLQKIENGKGSRKGVEHFLDLIRGIA